MNKIDTLLSLLSCARCDLSDEKRAQAEVESALLLAGIEHERECRLSHGDIVDFLVLGDIALEIKLKGARKKSVYQQLQRYASHETVRIIILMTNLSMGLPEEINGKPTYYVSMGRAWL